MAIIGRGDIARAIKDREGFIIYANGCSNRTPTTTDACLKELNEINNISPSAMLVYISTLSIYYSFSDYTQHKKNMEQVIKDRFDNYCILRIGNITWGDNPNTLINHLREDQSRIQKDTWRYLINKEELNHWIGLIPTHGQHIMNITGQRTCIEDIAMNLEDNVELIYSDRP